MMFRKAVVLSVLLSLVSFFVLSCQHTATVNMSKAYAKQEVYITMRDGVRLYTAIYTPKDQSEAHPILIKRTPYSINPYGEDHFPKQLGPSPHFLKENYIYVYQDVRGRFMSEGEYVNMRPIVEHHDSTAVDESTDAYDTIEWLINNIPNNNGRVGIWGISYPGFYAACALVDAHPALKAVSPQAPIADWWFDDFHHHGTFFLPHFFNFFRTFGLPHQQRKHWPAAVCNPPVDDAYDFYLNEIGPLKNINKRYFHHQIAFWDSICAHPDYDRFWQERNILPHLKDIKPAVLTVGGWFDAEDLYGPLKIYQQIETNSPKADNRLVMGPWAHGGWARTDGKALGDIFFTEDPCPSDYFQRQIELPFFNHYLKRETCKLPEAFIFETGRNQWHSYKEWPPANYQTDTLFLSDNQQLKFCKTESSEWHVADSFVSDPNRPVPYFEQRGLKMDKLYMLADQRATGRRKDVLVYQTTALDEAVTLAGDIQAELFVSTNLGDADWVVKLIDVYPQEHLPYSHQPDKPMANYQQLVRSEMIRGRYRNSYEAPEPFIPDSIAAIGLELLDIHHSFKKGHRIMIQIHSTWFPLMDRNPQIYIDNIYTDAGKSDFRAANHKVYRSADYSSALIVRRKP